MNEDIGAYRPFLSESSPTTLAVVSDRLRDDLPKTAFQTTACLLRNAEHPVISIYERKRTKATTAITELVL